MADGATEPTAEEIEAFYNANRENFRKPETFHAAHIVKHVNELQTEAQAAGAIKAALADLERGDPFPEVANRYSDCPGNGGDLGRFPAGHTVQEFEDAVRALDPGQRTGVFTTSFGVHIAILYAKIPGSVATLDEVREDSPAHLHLQEPGTGLYGRPCENAGCRRGPLGSGRRCAPAGLRESGCGHRPLKLPRRPNRLIPVASPASPASRNWKPRSKCPTTGPWS